MAILGESQTMLADLVSRYLSDNHAFEARQAALAKDGWPVDLWRAFAGELGIAGLPFTEAEGGLGLGALDVMVVMEALGRGLAAEPFLSSVVGFGALVNALAPDQREALTPLIAGVIAGEVRIALAIRDDFGGPGAGLRTLAQGNSGWRLEGNAALVPGAASATHILFSAATPEGDIALILLPRDHAGITLTPAPLIDGTMAGRIALDAALDADGLVIRNAGDALDACEHALLAALGAEIVGIIAALIDATVDFAGQRTQFGKAIAKFQVIQHRLADMYVEGELARSMALLAALKLDGNPVERGAAAAACKARTASAGRMVAQNAVQIHGGIGTTDELIVGHYFKRLLAIEALYGGNTVHVANYARHRAELGAPLAVV